MPLTNSSFDGTFVTSLEAALFPLCTMRHANSSLLDAIGTSLKIASLLFPRCAMRDTNSSLNNMVVTPLKIATLYLRAMCDTHASLLGLVGTPLKAASLHLGTMCDTNSSLNGLICTSSHELTSFLYHNCTMCFTNSPLNNLVGTPIKAARFPLRAMGDTNTCLYNPIGTSLVTASLHLHFCAMSNTYSSRDGLIGASLLLMTALFLHLFFVCGSRRCVFIYLLLRLLLDGDGLVVANACHRSTERHGTIHSLGVLVIKLY